jgi:hypothetical protein
VSHLIYFYHTTQGRAGGACTSALLQVLYRDGHAASEMSWVQCLRAMRANLRQMGFDQVPQLTSTRMIDVVSNTVKSKGSR